MLRLKKVLMILLSICISLTSITIFNLGNSYASSITYVKKAKNNTTYKYDLDGDGKKEKIRYYYEGEEVELYINGIKVETYESLEKPVVSICDFNKKDKSLDIVVKTEVENCYICSYIVNYSKGKVINHCLWGDICSFDSNTGIFKFFNYGYPDNDEYTEEHPEYIFYSCIGDFDTIVYYKVNKTSVKMKKSYSYEVASYVKTHKYKMKKKVTAYKSPTSKTKAFTLKVGEKMNIVRLYSNNNNQYIKVKNSKGKYGYVKTQASLIVSNPFNLKP